MKIIEVALADEGVILVAKEVPLLVSTTIGVPRFKLIPVRVMAPAVMLLVDILVNLGEEAASR